jgi:DNA polymerase I
MADQKKLFLLDGHALVYRAHYAFISKPLYNSKNVNTSAMVGFVRTLWDIISNQKPSHIAVSFDLSGPTFRHEMFPQYKANREAQPEDITYALPYIEKFVKAFNIPVVTAEGYEADDVIGTLAKQAEKEGFEVYMVTPDKDYAQLVSNNIFMYKPARMGNGIEILGINEILEKWEIERVDQVIDILGLQGDSVDNIPGIPGIGPKTAVKLLKEFGTVENLLQNAHLLKGKQRENIEQFAQQALLSKQLATIHTEAPVLFDSKIYEVEPFDTVALEKLFKELEMRTIAQSILGQAAHKESSPAKSSLQGSLFDLEAVHSSIQMPPPAPHAIAEHNISSQTHEYKTLEGLEAIQNWIKLLEQQALVAFDTETTDLDPHQAELVGISFSWQKHKAFWIPLDKGPGYTAQVLALLKPFFLNAQTTKIGQNIKYDMLVLKNHGIELKGKLEDTMIAHYLLEPELRHNMDYLAETYLKYQPVSITTLIGKKGPKQKSMKEVDPLQLAEYAAEDADVTFQLYEKIVGELRKDGKLAHLYDELEMPLVYVLTDMEHQGITLDTSILENQSRDLTEKILSLENHIFAHCGTPFNLASPKQVGEILFDHLKIPYKGAKTKTGQYSTDESKLSELTEFHPVVELLLEHRGLTKLKSTYVDALPKLVNPKTGKIHSSFNQTIAATGRLSSNNPNLQNIPIKTEEGRKIRKAFVPSSAEHVLLAADYSQIELRLIAEISQETNMLDAFVQGLDIHTATAAKIYKVPLEAVQPEQRRNAKTVNFSIIYGAGSTNLSQQLNISRQAAKELIDQYFKEYQGLKQYMDNIVKFAREHGYVETLLGRKRILRDIHSKNGMARSAAERIAVNTPIQGTAADMIKKAMIDIQKYLNQENLATKMILQVHDELVFDVPKNELEKVKPVIVEKMIQALPNLKVPVLVSAGVGSNWLEAH